MLKGLQLKIFALVYCPRYRTPDIFEQWEMLEANLHVKMFKIVEDFISPEKLKDAQLLKQFEAQHQSPELELENLYFLLRKENYISVITDKSCPKRPSRLATLLRVQLLLSSPSKH